MKHAAVSHAAVSLAEAQKADWNREASFWYLITGINKGSSSVVFNSSAVRAYHQPQFDDCTNLSRRDTKAGKAADTEAAQASDTEAAQAAAI